MKHLIIGNGIAGINGARSIRDMDRKAEIIMVSDETGSPYSRPMISNILDGSQSLERLALYGHDIYKELHITTMFGHRVTDLDTTEMAIRLTDSSEIGFDRLLIASGADARRLQVPGAELDHIFYMRTVKDVLAQVNAIRQGVRRALVLGGGLIGFKAAYGLLKRGISVTMLISSGYPLAMQVDKTAGQLILDELEAHGLAVRVGLNVCSFEGAGQVERAVLDSGETIDCDLIIAGKGVKPSLGFIRKEHIKTGTGILVNRHLRTSAPDIYAAGDTAEAEDIARGRRWYNAIWHEAAAQGRIAGYNMAGRPVRYRGSLSRNVIQIFNLNIMTLGFANPEPVDNFEILQARDEKAGTYRSLVFSNDILVGVVLVNRIEQGGLYKALIEGRVPVKGRKHDLLSPTFSSGWLI